MLEADLARAYIPSEHEKLFQGRSCLHCARRFQTTAEHGNDLLGRLSRGQSSGKARSSSRKRGLTLSNRLGFGMRETVNPG